jgi:hypothetical protein
VSIFTERPCEGPRRAASNRGRALFPTLDVLAQIRLFVKLKLTKCARAGNRAGLSYASNEATLVMHTRSANGMRLHAGLL